MGKRAPIKALPSREDILAILQYEPETGKFLWRGHRGSMAAGSEAGTISSRGYRTILINRTQYFAHRMAWVVMTGLEPTAMVDHIDGNRLNNAWSNLRAATHGENKINSVMYRNNTSGAKGVIWQRSHKKWRAVVRANGKTHHIGYFASLEDAATARTKAAERLQGEFFRAA